MKLFSIGALGLASGQTTCPSWEDTWPRAELKETFAQNGCTTGGHNGQLYSKCWLSCQDGYDMYFREESSVGAIQEYKSKTNAAEIKCRHIGKWKATKPFFCAPACPKMYKNNPWRALTTLYSADDGFIVRIRIEPEMDLDEWTAVLWFADEPVASISIDTWEADVTTSMNKRIATFCSYEPIAAGEQKKIAVTITGASKEELSNMHVRYIPGIHKDLSCNFDDWFGSTTTTPEPTTEGPTSTTAWKSGTTDSTIDSTTSTYVASCGDDNNFCIGKDPGFHAHCKCNKYYECWSEVTTIFTCPGNRLWNGYFCAEPSTVDTSNCEL